MCPGVAGPGDAGVYWPVWETCKLQISKEGVKGQRYEQSADPA